MTVLYEPLSVNKGEIRLLKVKAPAKSKAIPTCELSKTSLHKAPPYKALSYCWGPANDRKPILLNGKKFKVTKNLAAALRSLQKAPGYYWIDAICINQDDIEERSTQILRMKAIYNQAVEVVVWLGGQTLSISNVSLLRTLKVRMLYTNITTNNTLTFFNLVSKILRNGYWRRVWAVQEFVVATDIRFFDQRGSLSWDDLRQIMECWGIRHRFRLPMADEEEAVLKGANSVKRLISLRQQFLNTSPIYLLDLLLWSQSLLATEELDKVYGLLGLAHDGDIYVPNPHYGISLNELYQIMAKSMLQRTGNLDILCFERGDKDETLPSWAPCWLQLPRSKRTEYLVHHITNDRTPIFQQRNPRSLLRFNGNKLIVRGRKLDVIDGLSSSCYIGQRSTVLQDSPTLPANQTASPYRGHYRTMDAVISAFAEFGDFGFYDPGWNLDDRGHFAQHLGHLLSQWLTENKAFEINGKPLTFWLKETAAHKSMRRTVNAPKYCWEWLDARLENVLERFFNSYLYRSSPSAEARAITDLRPALRVAMESRMRFIVTEKGYVGMVARKALQGDVLVQLQGCRQPLAMRQSSGGWKIIGEGSLCDPSSSLEGSSIEGPTREFVIV